MKCQAGREEVSNGMIIIEDTHQYRHSMFSGSEHYYIAVLPNASESSLKTKRFIITQRNRLMDDITGLLVGP
jgi:hypothetical protein